ncbi:MAG: triphosphoribosyl-dephospho-CoA synthase [Methanotrichaceae archaeon]
MSPDKVAQLAQAAMLIELSSDPKPGNVDRCHDFSDIGFHQFIISAVSAYPIFREAACGQSSFGKLLLNAVKSWRDWNIKGNTHFGSLILMIPLAIAAGRSGDLRHNLSEVLRGTTSDDAADFYEAFALADARVVDVKDFSLKDSSAVEALRKQGKTLSDLMLLSKNHDLIAGEWSSDYERSFRLAEMLKEMVPKLGISTSVVRTYLIALAEKPDSLVQAKFGLSKALAVSSSAKQALKDSTLESARKLDLELLAEDVNPGSTADLIASALFIALLKGLKC